MRLPLRDLEATTAQISEKGGNAFRGQTILVTGGTGFVGRWLIETFLALNAWKRLGARILATTRNADRFRASAPHLADDPAMTIIPADFQGAELRCDLVIHGATPTSQEMAEDSSLVKQTTGMTRAVLDLAVRGGARRILYLSSGAVYGTQPADCSHIPEDFDCQMQTPYAETKRWGELLCRWYADRFGLEYVIARGFSFIGPHLPLDREFAAGNFLRNALNGNTIEVRGDGTPLRSYLYAADLAVWLWVMLLRGTPGGIYNAGSERSVSIAELAHEAATLTNPPKPVTIHQKADLSKPPARYVPSTERARTELGLEETVDWRAALRKTYEWWLQ